MSRSALRFLVIGVSGFLGSFLASRLQQNGHEILGVDLVPPKEADSLLDFERVDLRNVASVVPQVTDLVSRNAHLDCLLFLASVRPENYFASTISYNLETWQAVFDVNVTAFLSSCQAAFPALCKSKNASIISFASIYGLRGPKPYIYGKDSILVDEGIQINTPLSYSATKSALVGMTRHLAIEWAQYGIRVNALAPGGVINNQSTEFIKKYESVTPAGRMGNPQDLLAPIEFLAHPSSSYITGVTLPVDGGWSL